jgi:hypothetical protein
VVQVAPAVQADVQDSLDPEVHAQGLAHDLDSVRDLVRQAVCCPRVKALRRDVQQVVRLPVVVAISATRRAKKAR